MKKKKIEFLFNWLFISIMSFYQNSSFCLFLRVFCCCCRNSSTFLFLFNAQLLWLDLVVRLRCGKLNIGADGVKNRAAHVSANEDDDDGGRESQP